MTKRYLEQYDDGNPDLDIERLSNKQLRTLEAKVGRIVTLFNFLEANLEGLIVKVINNRSDQPGYAVISELTQIFTKKVTIFKALYGPNVECVDNQNLKRLFTKVVKSLFEVKEFRNMVAHANWCEASEDYEVRIKIASDDKGPYSVLEKIPLEKLDEMVKHLKSTISLLEDFDNISEI